MPRYAPKRLFRGLIDLIVGTDQSVQAETIGFLATSRPTRRERQRRAAEVARLLDRLRTELPPQTMRVVEASYDRADRSARKQAKRASSVEHAGLSQIQRETVSLLADNLLGNLRQATDRLGRSTDDAFRRHALRESLSQVAVEGPRGLRADFMQRRLEQDGKTAFVDKAGRRWTLTNYSRMAVRTTTSEAQNRAVLNVAVGRGLDLLDVDHHEHEVDVCSPYDGKTFSISGRDPDYPPLVHLPPFHPQCEHFVSVSRHNFDRLRAAA